MAELADILKDMQEQGMNAAQLTELRIGTITAVKPLKVKINTAMPELEEKVLLLTAAVVEKKIPVLKHSHTVPAGTTETAELNQHGIPAVQTTEALTSIACTENGKTLPVKDGYIILNRGLEVGDKVLMLRVMRGQQYLILSRVMEVS